MSDAMYQPNLLSRMFRAAKLDEKLYEEVEHDPAATKQSLIVIAIVSLAQAVGRAIDAYLFARVGTDVLLTSVLGFVETTIGLAMWSVILYWIGTHLFSATTTPGQIYRTTGLARSPGIFYVIPLIGFAVNIWILVAYVIAARTALDISTGKTLAAAVISFIPFALIQGLVAILFLGLA